VVAALFDGPVQGTDVGGRTDERQRHGIDPQRYLTSVLAKLPTTPPNELNQFLPDVWKQEDAAEPISTTQGEK